MAEPEAVKTVATIQTLWPDISKQRRDATLFREGETTDKMENNSNKRPEYKKREAWIEKIRNLCMEESKHTGIYPSVTIAMSILESADGTSNLALNHYNFFGMTMKSEGSVLIFWDGTSYQKKKATDGIYADYTQAGSYDAGFVMSLRHFGMNFWITGQYALNGVLDHVSKGLSKAAVRSDAIRQLKQIVPIYAPGFLTYEAVIIKLIDNHELWKYDEEFVADGGWDGSAPYPSITRSM